MLKKDMQHALVAYRRILRKMQDHTFYVQDGAGTLRRWNPPKIPSLDTGAKENA